MKMPAALLKGLSDEEKKRLESDLKSSVLAKQLRKYLKSHIENNIIDEESLGYTADDLCKLLGERRGFRAVLNLFPEE